MKKNIIGAGAALLCGSTYAQSSVRLYGLIDQSIRYQSSSSTSSHSFVGVNEGPINGNRFGFKGSEDLGGGLAAIFDLQAGYNIANGKSDQQSQLFGRYSWVGLQSNTYGSLKLGRQYGGMFNFYAFHFDPIGGGNINSTDWELFITGIRFDNTAQYDTRVGPISISLQHSFGNQAGSFGSGGTTFGSAIYTFSTGSVGIAATQSEDAGGRKLRVGSFGGTVNVGQFGLYIYGIDAQRDAGFSVAGTNTGGALSNANIVSNAITASGPQTDKRTDLFARVGATYQPGPLWKFIVSYAYDHAKNAAPGSNGTIQTVCGMADYILSKRTDVYLEIDRSHLSGASVNDPNGPLTFSGERNNLGAGLSLRMVF
ncbi:porin [Caballeronia sp. SEWSISQ10-4 2]|uniref:porin n=1 Tax=Caballeronia sp. SEWSISQ10-4 2 TaxID=2937438 RepID=UPI00265154E7|nr:porin [Caballeronia sp. SEWSISQ10-4 2]MDN7177106.1 porin [Caballeronia sp. SEWSISQ10-4 2]